MIEKVVTHAVQPGLQPLDSIKNILVVASGKGGVGKSTTAVNLALALAARGLQIGLLDADIYGPNQPQMLGISEQPPIQDQKLQPIVRYGLQTMSIGYLVDIHTPMIWRGPMVTTALKQLLYDTAWQGLDCLIMDLPPGTGDIQLTIAQKIPVSGAIIITTPQEVALADARRAIAMFHKVQVPILGIVENMSDYQCSHCGHHQAIFGSGGGKRLAKESQITFLGSLPLNEQIQKQTDSGYPTVIADPSGSLSQSYQAIAHEVLAVLAKRPLSISSKFPKIVVESNKPSRKE